MTPPPTTGQVYPEPQGGTPDLDRSRVALGRALLHFVLQRIPDDYTYSSAALNMLTRTLLDTVEQALAEHFAAMELEEEDADV